MRSNEAGTGLNVEGSGRVGLVQGATSPFVFLHSCRDFETIASGDTFFSAVGISIC